MVDELIAERGVRAPFIRMASRGDLLARECYLGLAGFGAEMPDQVDSAKVLAQFASGATIVLQGLHRLWPPLIDFVRQHGRRPRAPDAGQRLHHSAHQSRIRSALRRARRVRPAGGRAEALDRARARARRIPCRRSRGPTIGRRSPIVSAAKPVIDAVLSPGDALYLPRGWIHSAQALETTSIHLTIGVSPVTTLDVVHAVVDTLASDAEFRKSLPMGIDPTDHGTMAAMATKIMTEVADTMAFRAGEVTHAAAALLSQRHAERTRPAPGPSAGFAGGCRACRHHHGEVASRARRQHRSLRRPGRAAPAGPDHHLSDVVRAAVDALHHGHVADAGSLPGLDRADGDGTDSETASRSGPGARGSSGPVGPASRG